MESKANLLTERLQRRSASDLFKNRLLRWLVAGFLATLLVVSCIYYAGDSSLSPYVPYMLSRNKHRDVFVRSKGTRALVIITSDKIDEMLCYSAGSAYLSGIPVLVAGYQMPNNGPMSKLDFIEAAIKNVDLTPSDVVIAVDSDTIFTGMNLNPFIDRFIEQSAATPDKLDALAVRQGRAMAPFLAHADGKCLADSMFKTREGCALGYEIVYEKIRQYAAAHSEHSISLSFDTSPYRHLNAGVMVARVWALKEFLQKASNVTKTQSPPVKTERGWSGDESIFMALYLDLLTWEVDRDVFAMSKKELKVTRSPYGVRAGLIGLEFSDKPLAIGALQYIHQSELNDVHWARYVQLDAIARQHSHDTTSFKSMNQFVSDLYKRAYTAYGERIYTNLAVPKWSGKRTTSKETSIVLTPPLLALKPRSTASSEGHTYPAILHVAGLARYLTKIKQMESGAVSARWLVPMVHDTKAKNETMAYLKTVPLFLSTSNSITWESYHAQCGFPFEETIKMENDF